MAGYIGSKTSVTQVDGYNRTEADDEFVNDPNSVITVSGSNVGIGTSDTTTAGQAGKLKVRNDVDYSSAEFEDNATLVLQNETDNHSATIVFHSDNGSNSSKRAGIVGGNINSNTSAIGFYGDISNKTATTKPDVLIDSSGNLFVGKTSKTDTPTSGGAYIHGNSNAGSTNYYAQFFVEHNSSNNHGIVLKELNASSGIAVAFLKSDGGVVGSINTTTSSTVYGTSSDYRLKTDAQPMTGASARVQALNPVNFEWIADGTRVDGFLAHEAQEVVPEAVTGTKDAMRDEEYEVTPAVLDEDGNVVTEAVMGTRSVPDYQGIDQSKLVPLLTAALQEALTEIADLKARVTALEAV